MESEIAFTHTTHAGTHKKPKLARPLGIGDAVEAMHTVLAALEGELQGGKKDALDLLVEHTDTELPDGMQDTPVRFIEYLLEFYQPFSPEQVLGAMFEGPSGEGAGIHSMIVQHNIPFRMCCEHHLLPAWGRAAIGYVPYKKVVGLSKLARLVDACGTRRPSMQEIICEEIATTLETYTEARGVITLITAEHGCMACRGINAPGVKTSTSCVRGVFRDVVAAREEFFNIIREGIR